MGSNTPQEAPKQASSRMRKNCICRGRNFNSLYVWDKKKTLRRMLKKAILAHETSLGSGVTGFEFQVVRDHPLKTRNFQSEKLE